MEENISVIKNIMCKKVVTRVENEEDNIDIDKSLQISVFQSVV